MSYKLLSYLHTILKMMGGEQSPRQEKSLFMMITHRKMRAAFTD